MTLIHGSGRLLPQVPVVDMHAVSGSTVAIVISLAVLRSVFWVVALQQRRALLREAFEGVRACGFGTISIKQKRGRGSPALDVTFGDVSEPAPAAVVVIVVKGECGQDCLPARRGL